MFVRRSNERPGEVSRETEKASAERVPEARTPEAIAGSQLNRKVKPSSTKSIIDTDVGVAGTVSCTGELDVLGQIQGDLHCSILMVGHTGHIHGDVFADHAHVDGRVDGNIRGKQIILGSNAHVTGDIHHASLVIEHGAIFEGKVRRSSNPNEVAAAPQADPTRAPAPQQSAPPPTEQRPAAPQASPLPQDASFEGSNGVPENSAEIGRWPRQILATQ